MCLSKSAPAVVLVVLCGCGLDRRGIQVQVASPGADSAVNAPLDGGVDTMAAPAAPAAADTGVDIAAPGRQADASAVACGSGRPDLSGINRVDGLALGPDGTLYFTTSDGMDGWIGRLEPGHGPDTRWLRITGAPILTGLAFDDARNRLYAASVSGSAILAFQLSGTGAAGSVLIGNVEEINDLTLDSAGEVYFSRQSDRHIYRVGLQGVAMRVTRDPLGGPAPQQSPAGLAFGPDGSLFVGLKNGGRIHRIALASGNEASRTTFGAFEGWANGLAFDSRGRLYVGVYDGSADTQVIRLEPDGTNPTEVVSGGRFASLAFGRGTLDCHDLYIADPGGPLRRLQTDASGLIDDL